MIANSIFARPWAMIGESSDKDFIQRLVAFTGMSASETALKAGLAVSTLTRPLNQPVRYKLSKATIDKLRATYPDFPDWAERPDLPDAEAGRDYLMVEIMPSFGGMGGGGPFSTNYTRNAPHPASFTPLVHESGLRSALRN